MAHRVIFQPSGNQGDVPTGTTLLEAARQLGTDIEATCGGQGICHKCRVAVQSGFFERFGISSNPAHLNPIAERERDLPVDHRLACLAQVQGPVLIFVPEASRAHRQIVRKGAREIAVPLNPAVRKVYVTLLPPTLDDQQPDWERLQTALNRQHGLTALEIDYAALITLPENLRAGKWSVTVTIWGGRRVMVVEPGYVDRALGLAIDIGTTTIAAYLCDLTSGAVIETGSMMNPQTAYGDDVMARITYTIAQSDGLATLRTRLLDGLNTLIAQIIAQANVTSDDILEAVIVGNTCMHHILLGIAPRIIGLAPFTPARREALDINANVLGLDIHPTANIHLLPVVSGFLGADIIGCLVAEQIHEQGALTLLIDIGTNGEMVLGNHDRLVAASCATGPAFEGAQIEFGMRAAYGAIEQIEIDPLTWDVRYKVIGCDSWSDEGCEIPPRGICGSGIIDLGWELVKAGVIDAAGRFVSDPRLREAENGERAFVLVPEDASALDCAITFSSADVQALQLAKAAMYAAARIMLRHFGADHVDRVILAGAFGSYIDPIKAMASGLFPDVAPEAVVAVGNAAGDGARLCLLNTDLRTKANELARCVKHLELTREPDFDRLFADALHFPHAHDTFPHLAEQFATARIARYTRVLSQLPLYATLSPARMAEIAAQAHEQQPRKRKPVDLAPNDVCIVLSGQINIINASGSILVELAPGDYALLNAYPAETYVTAGSIHTRVLIVPAR